MPVWSQFGCTLMSVGFVSRGQTKGEWGSGGFKEFCAGRVGRARRCCGASEPSWAPTMMMWAKRVGRDRTAEVQGREDAERGCLGGGRDRG